MTMISTFLQTFQKPDITNPVEKLQREVSKVVAVIDPKERQRRDDVLKDPEPVCVYNFLLTSLKKGSK